MAFFTDGQSAAGPPTRRLHERLQRKHQAAYTLLIRFGIP